MAFSLSEIQTILANLKATYLSLTTKLASEVKQRDRDVLFVEMSKVRKEIEEWEQREQMLQDQGAGSAGGVAYVTFQRPS